MVVAKSDPKEEKTERFKDLTRDKLQEVYPFDISFQSQVVHGVNFITLDDVYGYVTAHQVQQFKEEALPRVFAVSAITCSNISYHSFQYLLYPHGRYCDDPWQILRQVIVSFLFGDSKL